MVRHGIFPGGRRGNHGTGWTHGDSHNPLVLTAGGGEHCQDSLASCMWPRLSAKRLQGGHILHSNRGTQPQKDPALLGEHCSRAGSL